MRKFLILLFILLFLPVFVFAQDVLGENKTFNIESSYDLARRSDVSAVLVKISPQLYWYADNAWWESLAETDKDDVKISLNSLTEEFENNIYPKLTALFGNEWNPGIDKDSRITILIHQMKRNSGGYTDTSDEYPKIQAPDSNEREMIYLNSDFLGRDIAKSFLAHEFMHLVAFNQKDRAYGVSDDVWINEARAEYASTFLGYDKNYSGSNLQSRVKNFLEAPFDSLTEWRETTADYGVANLFVQYLVDHYGVEILVDSLKSREIGIRSLNTSLARRGYKADFAKIFTDWAVAVLLNNCQIAEEYCYFNKNLQNFRVTPFINYLPLMGDSVLSVNNTTKDWAGNWHKFLGGRGQLKVEFKAQNQKGFAVPYVIEDLKGNFTVKTLQFNQNMEAVITLDDFGSRYASLTILPIAQNKISGFSDIQPSYSFFWSASAKSNTSEKTEAPANTLKEQQIAVLKTQIMEVQLKIIDLLRQLIQLLLTQSRASANM